MSWLPHNNHIAGTGDLPIFYTNASWDVASINEDGTQTATFTITANPTLVANGTTVVVTLSGTNVTIGDISGVASLTPTVTINSGTGSFTITATADLTTEGAETITATLNSADSAGQPTNSLNDTLVLNDTSKPGYSGSFDVNSITENGTDTATYNLSAIGVPNGTTVNYTMFGTGITAGDISVPLTGTLTINSQAAALSFTATPDFTAEGTETIQMNLNGIDSLGNSVSALDTFDIIDITDTSLPEYSVQFTTTYNSNAGIRENETDTATFTVTTQGVPNGTTVGYTVDGVGISVGDISLTSLTGTLTINGGTAAVGPFTATADNNTEGNETLRIILNSTDSLGNSTGTTANRSDTIIIYDTSATPQYTQGLVSTTSITENESDTCVYTISGSALTNGTLDVTLSGTGITVGDLLTSTDGTNYAQPASLTIAVPITSNSGALYIRAQADNATEGLETILINTASSDSNSVTVGLPLTQRSCDIVDSSTLQGVYNSASWATDTIVEGTENYTDLGGNFWQWPSSTVFTITTTNIAANTTVGYTISGTSSTSDWEVLDRFGPNGGGTYTGQNSTRRSTAPWSSATTGVITISVANNIGQLELRTLPRPGTRNGEGAETVIITLDATDNFGVSTGSLSDTLTIYEEPTYSLTDDKSGNPNEGDTITYTFSMSGGPPAAYIDAQTFNKRYNYAIVSPATAAADPTDISSGFSSSTFSTFNTSNKSHSWTSTFSNDTSTEGTESYVVEVIKIDNGLGANLGQLNTFIQDTSTGAPLTTFAFDPTNIQYSHDNMNGGGTVYQDINLFRNGDATIVKSAIPSGTVSTNVETPALDTSGANTNWSNQQGSNFGDNYQIQVNCYTTSAKTTRLASTTRSSDGQGNFGSYDTVFLYKGSTLLNGNEAGVTNVQWEQDDTTPAWFQMNGDIKISVAVAVQGVFPGGNKITGQPGYIEFIIKEYSGVLGTGTTVLTAGHDFFVAAKNF